MLDDGGSGVKKIQNCVASFKDDPQPKFNGIILAQMLKQSSNFVPSFAPIGGW
jgi:hypothetical protein